MSATIFVSTVLLSLSIDNTFRISALSFYHTFRAEQTTRYKMRRTIVYRMLMQ